MECGPWRHMLLSVRQRASELLVPPQACDEGARQVGTGHFGVRVGVLLQGTAEAAGAGRAPRDT